MIPPHVDTILVKNYYEFFSENLGIDSTRDRYRESFFSSFATAGWALRFLRAVGFLWSQFLVFFSETSGIDVTLLGPYNAIRPKSNSNGIMPN